MTSNSCEGVKDALQDHQDRCYSGANDQYEARKTDAKFLHSLVQRYCLFHYSFIQRLLYVIVFIWETARCTYRYATFTLLFMPLLPKDMNRTNDEIPHPKHFPESVRMKGRYKRIEFYQKYPSEVQSICCLNVSQTVPRLESANSCVNTLLPPFSFAYQ